MNSKSLIALFFTIFSFQNAFAQSCFPDGLTIRAQWEIDQFATNFPNCTVIEGNFSIEENRDSLITNLKG